MALRMVARGLKTPDPPGCGKMRVVRVAMFSQHRLCKNSALVIDGPGGMLFEDGVLVQHVNIKVNFNRDYICT